MTIILCDISALEFWRFDAIGTRRQPTYDAVLRKNSSSFTKPGLKQIRTLRESGFAFLSEPVHVLVPDGNSWLKCPEVQHHIRSGRLPRDSFVRIAEGIYACTPDAAFIQTASRQSLAHAVLTGLELCGTFRRSAGGRPTIYQQRPLTSVASLASFVSKAEGMHGTARARQALLYIADGSESPMEAVLVVLLCFPVRLGGYGLPLPTLNFRIPATAPVRRASGRESFRCDLFWPEAKLALEYDGRESHEGEANASKDNARNSGLVSMGFDIIPMTKLNLKDIDQFDVIARAIARRLGRRIRSTERDWTEKRVQLRNEILPWKTDR